MFYGNRTEKEIAFRSELETISCTEMPHLKVVHVLSKADNSWMGEQGNITIERIKKECTNLDGWVFYLCGPPRMMVGLVRDLKNAGVKGKNIRSERFSI